LPRTRRASPPSHTSPRGQQDDPGPGAQAPGNGLAADGLRPGSKILWSELREGEKNGDRRNQLDYTAAIGGRDKAPF